MSVTLDGEIINLVGSCGVDDTEPLLGFLQAIPGCKVDLTKATHLHGAVLQLMLAFRPPLSGKAGDVFIQSWLTPLIETDGR